MIGALIPALAGVAETVIDRVLPDTAERDRVKAELTKELWRERAQLQRAAADIVKAEVTGKGLKTWWRPVTMLVFLGMLVSWWFGLTPDRATPELMGELFELIKIGLGGYIGGRSIEKVVPHVTAALEGRKRDGGP